MGSGQPWGTLKAGTSVSGGNKMIPPNCLFCGRLWSTIETGRWKTRSFAQRESFPGRPDSFPILNRGFPCPHSDRREMAKSSRETLESLLLIISGTTWPCCLQGEKAKIAQICLALLVDPSLEAHQTSQETLSHKAWATKSLKDGHTPLW